MNRIRDGIPQRGMASPDNNNMGIIQKEKLQALSEKIAEIISKIDEMEMIYMKELAAVHPVYKKSALNLVHYLALRSFDVDQIQDELRELGLPGLSNVEAHVMNSLLAIKTIINFLNGNPVEETRKGIISVTKSKKILNQNTKMLFGYKSKKRRTRIMVTLPEKAANDYFFVNRLMKLGMNSARINCAHDGGEIWEKMIFNVRKSSAALGKSCKIMMDLAGPKLRTGHMLSGPEVIHVKPERDSYGNVSKPAKVWIAPQDVIPPDETAHAIFPVSEEWFTRIKRGDKIKFSDTRGKLCEIIVERKKKTGRWGYCYTSAYISTGTEFHLISPDGTVKQGDKIGEILPVDHIITLRIKDTLILHKDQKPGEPAQYDTGGNLVSPAHISCALPELYRDAQIGESIFFDDGKIEGIIENVTENELTIRIVYAKEKGSKLQSDKGINIPSGNLKVSGLTPRDKKDIEFIVKHADVLNLSFVNDENDVQQILDELKKHNVKTGIILKIETKKGFKNLPVILLKAMQTYPIGVMIARGDLAIETGWRNFATIQEEILRVSEAAHIPDIWATQVLDNLAKKGVPSRAEITDAAMAQRSECVMLNKGFYILDAVKMLDRILRQMQQIQKKKENVLPRLENAEKLLL